ncbi:DNA repair protein rhp57 [Drechslerella dactyloides]|uniref:DNA repair protein rhp57 n=1 Tax=Drechslerella dactyloides TaxID=74499 RepID=A0AAD6J0N5_DREDA|nr:DNA repair protein rhp57 [Drechslerella dactyloides]
MTDILTLLPNIYTTTPQLRPLLDRHSPAFDACNITTVDLVTLDPRTICQRARISLNDVNRIVDAVRDALNSETLGPAVVAAARTGGGGGGNGSGGRGGGRGRAGRKGPAVGGTSGRNMAALGRAQGFVAVGDDGVDGLLSGGVMTGSVTEIVGESGVGKTQMLLRLCFAIQQPPHNRSAIYICTESQISTKRMASMLAGLQQRQVPGWETLSLDRIQTAMCQYLDTLEHIVRYQLPVAIDRFGVGLVIVDSIAANFRVDDDDDDTAGGDSNTNTTSTTPKPKEKNKGRGRVNKLARRAGDIVRLGTCLKEMAVRKNIAIVVANQVSDVFEPYRRPNNNHDRPTFPSTPSTLPSSSRWPPGYPSSSQDIATSQIPSTAANSADDDILLTYDYQARWFTGWGDVDETDEALAAAAGKLKTPALGMAWTNLLDARIALVKGTFGRPVRGDAATGGVGGAGDTVAAAEGEEGWEEYTRRWMRVVFAPWAESGVPLEYEIWEGGVRGLKGRDTNTDG